MKHSSIILFISALLCFLFGISNIIGCSLVIGTVRLEIIDKYRGLDLAGVIDQSKLHVIAQGSLNGDWMLVPLWLSSGLDRVIICVWIISVFLCLNGVLLTVVAWKLQDKSR